MQLHEALHRLDIFQRKQIAFSHALGLISYDGATAAPKGSAANRAETMGILSEESYKLATCDETVKLIDALYARSDELDVTQCRIVKTMHKDIGEMRRIPMDEYVAFEKLTVEAEDVWHKAKETNDYPLFKPYLSRLIAGRKKMMGYIFPGRDPYEALLDTFEKGLTRERCDHFFNTLRRELVPLIQRISASRQVDDSMLHGSFPLEKQRELSDYLMRVLGIDRAYCTIAETEHPFTTGFTKYDIRITTHYHQDTFASSMYSVIHEGGHALYDLHPDDALAYTVLGGGVSMGIHESQSRFYENIIGRSRAFISLIAPKLRELFPQLAAYSDEALYQAFNRAEPSLIRTEADELTYCLHVLIRYELEQALFDGTLTVDDLPEAWNNRYRDYLGVAVPSDSLGVLQDSHWSGAMFGYFPSYALGSAYSAQMLAKMKETVNVDKVVTSGDLTPVSSWLRDHIWRFGGLYDPADLLERAFDAPFDPSFYIDYLKEKYSAIYHL